MVAKTAESSATFAYCVFPTELGWMAAVGRDGKVTKLTIGHATEKAAHAAIARELPLDASEKNWNPALVRRLQAFAKGAADDFSDVSVDESHWTPFQRQVIKHCRRIGPGRTRSYAELAALAGSPGAARAVGNCLAKNRIPLVIPCHRVVGSGGHLGGFSAGEGIPFKRRLLELEGAGK